MMDHLSFRLPEAFVDGYKDKHIEWGFDIGGGNSLSELTYITKYSMKREDGSKERWHETCERVINGMFSILKDHAKMNGTYWNGNQAMYSAKEAYDRMFYFKWTPPGRGIENMGKAIVNKERNSAQLFNCSFISTEKLSTASVSLATRPFVLLMEQSLNGIGVGYDTLGAGKINLSSPRIDPDTNEYTIEDTREAWAASLGQLLECFFFPGRSLIRFDYSQLRAAGTPLKRAGGTASGPEPLIRMHEKIVELLINRDGEAITDMDIMDICNLAAKAVVSGGKRRSALLALGSIDSKEFINAKNWEVFPERNGQDGWAHQSNNSIVYQNSTDISSLFELIANNGEPGLVNIEACRNYGRLADGETFSDQLVQGVNPCGEATLEPYEFCNLNEVFLPHADSPEDFCRTLKFAYLYSKAVTLLPTPWPEVNEVLVRNRRIGTGITGVAGYLEEHGWHGLREILDIGYKEIQKWDETYSAWLGVRNSIKTTVVKPSGTTSIVGNVTPGVHWPVTSGRFMRTQRFSASDPMLALFEEAGYKIEPDIMNPDFSRVVYFPTAGFEMRSEKEVSIWEKAALAALCQRYWADQSVSVTITFNPTTEAKEVGPVIKAYSDQLKTMSFLPMDPNSYPQMPIADVSEQEWEDARAQVQHIDWSTIYDTGIGLDAEGDKFCNNDHCEIPQR